MTVKSLVRGVAEFGVHLVPIRGVLSEFCADGTLLVRYGAAGELMTCDWLEQTGCAALNIGDTVLVVVTACGPGVVLGRIGRYAQPQPQSRITLEATEALTLKCGEASVEMRADGKVMVKGEDVLLRARGTQRIRAGNVAIN
jgi:hypothetical protein